MGKKRLRRGCGCRRCVYVAAMRARVESVSSTAIDSYFAVWLCSESGRNFL